MIVQIPARKLQNLSARNGGNFVNEGFPVYKALTRTDLRTIQLIAFPILLLHQTQIAFLTILLQACGYHVTIPVE